MFGEQQRVTVSELMTEDPETVYGDVAVSPEGDGSIRNPLP